MPARPLYHVVDPTTLLTEGEEEVLASQRELLATGGREWAAEVAARGGLAAWEWDLLKDQGEVLPEPASPDPAVAERAVAEARRQIDRITALQTRRAVLVASLREEMSEIDLDEAQDLLDLPRVREAGPVAWVEALLAVTGQQEAGPLLRLMAGVQSAQARRDGNVEWGVRPEPSWEDAVVTVTASSARGCWRDRAWELSACLEVRQDEHLEVLVLPHGPAEGHSLVVHSSSGVPGHHTTYRGVVVGEMVVRWWMSALARQGVRGAVASSVPCEAGPDDMRHRLITADLAAMDLLELATRRLVALTTTGDATDTTIGDMAEAIHQAYPCAPMREEHLLLVTAMAGQAANLLLAAADQAGRDPLALLARLREQTVQDAADLMGRS